MEEKKKKKKRNEWLMGCVRKGWIGMTVQG